MDEQIKELMQDIKESLPMVAEIVAILRDEYIKQGFTREEAITLCLNYNVSRGK